MRGVGRYGAAVEAAAQVPGPREPQVLPPDAPVVPSWPPAFCRIVRTEAAVACAGSRGVVVDLGSAVEHLEAYVGVAAVTELVLVDTDGVRAAVRSARARSLGLPAWRSLVLAPGSPLPQVEGAGVDTVVSVAHLAGAADARAVLADVVAALAPGGQVLAVEPVADHRRWARRLGEGPMAWRAPGGGASSAALPSTIRATGFTITDLERITLPRTLWPLHQLVRLRAIPTPPLPEVGS